MWSATCPRPTLSGKPKRHLYIDATENEKMEELRADAEFYAEPNVDGCWGARLFRKSIAESYWA